MSELTTTNTVFQVVTALKTATGTPISMTYTDSSDVDTEGTFSRFVIGSGTADYTVDTGNLTSFDKLILIFSAVVDKVTLSTLVADENIGELVSCVAIDGLGSESVVHIDASSTVADVTCDMMLISNE